MYKFELKSGYRHIDISKHQRQSLGDKWAWGAATSRYFCSIVSPFKPSSGPYMLKKTFRPQVRFWTSTLMRRSCSLVHDSINRPRLYPSYPSLLRDNHTHETTTLCRRLKRSRDLNAETKRR